MGVKLGIPMTATRPDGLTERQADILRWITVYILRERTSPTLREVMSAFGISSPNGAIGHLRTLLKKRALEGTRRYTYRSLIPRGLRLVAEYDDTPEGQRLAAIMAEESPPTRGG